MRAFKANKIKNKNGDLSYKSLNCFVF